MTVSKTSLRTGLCGEVGPNDIGSTVSLCGWVDRRREHGEHLAFIDLRDHSGVVQVVVDGAADLRSEYVVRVVGTVVERPEGTVNPELATGAIEIQDVELEILSRSETPPFPLHDRFDGDGNLVPTDETTRLRHRYVDLRRERMQKNMRTRAVVNRAIRAGMDRQGFIEVETPTLIASTPEGARDFVVPSRQKPGTFYALPQSPQIFKQLCMVGGIDRYYQIARCYRDEDLRADRQFEFTQLDAEASFVTPEDVYAFITEAVSDATEAVTGTRPGEFPRMTWLEAQERYGTDKPDVRFGLELVELTDIFATTEFKAFQADCIKGIREPGGAGRTRRSLDDLTDQVKEWGGKGLVWMRVEEDLTLNSPVAKFLTDDEMAALVKTMEAEAGDLLFLVADRRQSVRRLLGLLRLEIGRMPVTEGGFNFLWIVDFPLFEDDKDGRPEPAHHAFTMPHEDDVEALGAFGDPVPDDDTLRATRAQCYDLVLNGWELGSGSVRIHRPDIQQRVFEMLGIPADEAQRKFGFLMDAFKYGAPPHAGFAFGIDRLVALLAGEENIREVIAYPKTQSGADPLTAAPSPIDDTHLTELGLRTLPPAE